MDRSSLNLVDDNRSDDDLIEVVGLDSPPSITIRIASNADNDDPSPFFFSQRLKSLSISLLVLINLLNFIDRFAIAGIYFRTTTHIYHSVSFHPFYNNILHFLISFLLFPT